MKTFTIDSDNNITAHATREAAANAAGERFSAEEELATVAADWPGARLIEIWNSLPGVQPVRKFTSRKVAVRRIWAAIQNLEATAGEPPRTPAAQARGKGKKSSRADLGPKARSGTKTEQVIALLKQPSGATLKQLMGATAWQAHSVRGFISGQVAKKMGLRVKSFERNGERVYAIR